MIFLTVLVLLMLGKSITGVPQDLSGKVFTFPEATDTAHVKIVTPNLQLGAATVCVRFFTDLTREYALFSLATRSQPEAFHVVANRIKIDEFQFAVGGGFAYFRGHNVKLNVWQSVCGTWKAGTGLTQFWLNGYRGNRLFTSASNLSGVFLLTLGQDQDSFGGGFQIQQSFVGMISDLQMWDYVLTPDQIQAYTNKGSVDNGNILSWTSLNFQITGRILIEDEQRL